VIAGDSAGGGLSVALLLALRDRGLTLPKCSILISPWTDLTPNSCMQNSKLWNCHHASYNSNNLCIRFAKAYIGNASPKNPSISPYYANLAGLPPMLITAGGNETLLFDIEKFYKKCIQHGVDATFHVAENMPHVHQILHQGYKNTDESLKRIQNFIQINVNI